MRETTPQVFLVAEPIVNYNGMDAYLRCVGGQGWMNTGTVDSPSLPNDCEILTEFAGRLCYQSWKPGINPNVTKVRTDPAAYFDNLLASRHGSVLEHASYSFVFHNVSRVFTHELVRHRVGVAISEKSLRYFRLTDLGFRIPPALDDRSSGLTEDGHPMHRYVVQIVEKLEEFQNVAAATLGVGDDGVPFAVKKEVTSALRRLAPLGLSTDILWTANLRTLRNVIELRTALGAEEEMRLVFDKVATIMVSKCPLAFQDFHREPPHSKRDRPGTVGTWVPKYSKV